MEVAAAPSATSATLPEVPQKSATELDSDPAVKSALTFLNDPRVKNTPLDCRLAFLRTKGMTPEQIRHACAKAGIQVTEEQILNLQTQSRTAAVAPPPTRGALNPYKATQPPRATQSQMLYPHSPPPQPEPVAEKSYDWRDIVIGTGAAVLGGFGAFKLFQRYSPFEVRRKPDPRAARGRLQRPNNGTSRRPFPRSSGSDTDTFARPPPLPPAPTEPPKPQKDDEEIKRLETELASAKESLANERKRAADLAVSSAKARGEKQQLVRTNDRLTEQVDELKARIEELEKELAKKGDDDGAAPQSPRDTVESGTHDFAAGTPRGASRPGSRASSPRSRPGTPAGLTLAPTSTTPKPEGETVSPVAVEPAAVAVIDPIGATVPSQEDDMDGC